MKAWSGMQGRRMERSWSQFYSFWIHGVSTWMVKSNIEKIMHIDWAVGESFQWNGNTTWHVDVVTVPHTAPCMHGLGSKVELAGWVFSQLTIGPQVMRTQHRYTKYPLELWIPDQKKKRKGKDWGMDKLETNLMEYCRMALRRNVDVTCVMYWLDEIMRINLLFLFNQSLIYGNFF